jgi:hypothetical protein
MPNKAKNKGRPKSAPTKRKMPTRVISGQGDYKTAIKGLTSKMDGLLKRIPKGSGSKLGMLLGGPMGSKLGAGLSAITGYGDYSVSENTVSKVSTSVDMVPQFSRSDHSVRVAHREFIRDVVVPASPTAFNNTDEVINPANNKLFPWLAQMSLLYTQYKIHGMVFTYKSMSTNFSTGGPLGTVVMATNYNVNDKPFDNKIQMENAEFSVSCNPSQSLIHAIECDPAFSGLQTLYIRDPNSAITSADSDNRFFDFGRYQLATTGLPGTIGTVMGELWVSYDIEFMKPVIGSTPLTGISLVSQADGTTSVGPLAKILSCNLQDVFTPVANTLTRFCPSTVGPLGDIIMLRTPANPNGNFEKIAGIGSNPDSIRFYKSGNYSMIGNIIGDTTLTNFKFITGAIQTPYYPVITNGGGASGSNFRQTPFYRGSNASMAVVAPSGFSTEYNAVIVVSVPVEGLGNYVDVTLPSFTSSTDALISSVTRTLSINWARYGENNQSSAFSPAFRA